MRVAKEIVDQILLARGYGTNEEKQAFLSPNFETDLHDILLAKDAEKLVARLEKAITSGEKIVLFGDYDADGIPATALAYRTLCRYTSNLQYVIPRRSEGYGLTSVVIERILGLQPDVVLCLDNGSVAAKEVEALAAHACVLIIDHHEVVDERADAAFALVNPKQADCRYPFKELCACGLTWKIFSSFLTKIGEDSRLLRWELDLVAISTVADMVPLVSENRVLAQYGLQVLRKSRNRGLQALSEVAGVSLKEASSSMIGYVLAPRLNAPSRMHSEEENLLNIPTELLIGKNLEKISSYALHLQTANTHRQAVVAKHLEEAFEQANFADPVIVVWGENWSTGVIGLVASRLVEHCNKSAIVLAKENNTWKGSARAYGHDSVLKLFALAKELFERAGGHVKAGGFTLAPLASPEDLRQVFEKYPPPVTYQKNADVEVALSECTVELSRAFQVLEPFGIGNPAPRLGIEATITSVRRMGKAGEHLSLQVTDGGIEKEVVIFGFTGEIPSIGQDISLTCQLQTKVWNGRERLQLIA